MAEENTPSRWTDSWHPVVNLETPAGEMLRRLVWLAPVGSVITLFGSAPLQLCLDARFLSADVDCLGPEGFARSVQEEGLDNQGLPLYVQVCDPLSFRTHPLWVDRAYSYPLDQRIIRIPHPIDILIGKLNRLDEKDLRAFELVREKTGHPTEEEMIRELQGAVDLFRPGFDEETAQDMKITTRLLWQSFFQKDLDVAEQIIRPAQQRRQAAYDRDRSLTDHKKALKSLRGEP